MTPRRSIAVAALAGAVVAGGWLAFASLALEDYVYASGYAFVAFYATWVLAVTGVVLWRPRWQVVVTSVLPALVALYGTAGLAAHATRRQLYAPRRVVAPDGRFEVRFGVTYGYENLADAGWEARVRTGSGLLTRERVVWSRYLPGLEGADVTVRVTGPHSIEVVAEGQVDAVTF
jgi:hypothetical protein